EGLPRVVRHGRRALTGGVAPQRWGRGRKVDPEGRPAAPFALEADLAAHRLHEALGDREPDAGAFDGGRIEPQAVERTEELGAPRLRNAGAGVGDAHAKAFGSARA